MRVKPEQKELPIFLDLTGRRWRLVKLWVAAIITAAFICVFWFGHRVVSTENSLEQPIGTGSVDRLADLISRTNVPVIGKGPLVRVVKVNGQSIGGIFNGASSRKLSPEETVLVGTHQYAIERFGMTSPQKRLVLTFDDGPDRIFTTQLLDVLSRESVPATFFVIGNSVVQYPDVARRIAREGHGIANHSFTHADFESIPAIVAEQEINLTSRVIRATTDYDSTFFRPPYVGDTDQSLRDSVRGILQAQKLGYTAALYDYDTNDWQYSHDEKKIKMPPFDGQDHVLLLHDGGGDRTATIEYVSALITEARRHGYTFVTLSALYPANHTFHESLTPSTEDKAVVAVFRAALVWPMQTTFALFSMTVVFVFIGMGLFVVLAIIQRKRTAGDRILDKIDYCPAVAVVVPAYNEEKVLKHCVSTIMKSTYKNLKVLIVDDGSTDNTWRVAQRLEEKYENVRAFRQENAGKAAALNLAIKRTWSPIIIGIDADTVFLPDTVSRLVRHFRDPTVGAVAGLVRVGNRSSILARCQALEYATSISLERTAHTFLNAVMVVPGACGAWRRKAIIDAGRYSSATLAEDCDLTIGVHVAGYRVIQDNTAVSLTEVPATVRSFARQRFRWAYGNMQVYWKYQDILFTNRHGWLDSFVLPLAVVGTIGPLFFLPLLAAIAFGNIINGQYATLLIFMAISFCFQFLRAYVGLALGNESLKYLWLVPIARMLYGPLRVYLIYGTVLKAFQGVPVGWDKLARAGMGLPFSRPSAEASAKLKT